MAEERKYKKPVPRVDEEARPFWEACARHELYVQKCRSCGKTFYYPRSFCPEDLSQDLEWVRCSGKGKVYTFTVTRQNQGAGFRDNLPYVMAYVELDEGVRMLAGIVDSDPQQLAVGAPVQVCFERIGDEFALPMFRLANGH